MDHDKDDNTWCTAEYPGDEFHAGQLCERQSGHDGPHACAADFPGTGYTRTLTWAQP
jgi:hypothetical protein